MSDEIPPSQSLNDREFVDRIIAVCSKEAGFKKPSALLHNSRDFYAAKFRDDAVFLARTNTSLSYPQLATIFRRDHSTLVFAYQRAVKRREKNPPRRDGRTWVEWHSYLLEKVKGNQ